MTYKIYYTSNCVISWPKYIYYTFNCVIFWPKNIHYTSNFVISWPTNRYIQYILMWKKNIGKVLKYHHFDKMDVNVFSVFYNPTRGSHLSQVWFNLIQWFQKRKFKCKGLRYTMTTDMSVILYIMSSTRITSNIYYIYLRYFMTGWQTSSKIKSHECDIIYQSCLAPE